MLYNKVVIDLDVELSLLETIYLNKIPNLIDPMAKIWLPTHRYPNKYKEFKKTYADVYIEEHLSSNPYMPVFSTYGLKPWLISMIYFDKSDNTLFEKNVLMKNSSSFVVDSLPEVTEYIPDEFLAYLSNKDCDEISNIQKGIYENKIKPYTSQFPYNVFDINMDSRIIYLENKGEIGTYRYNEYIEYIKANSNGKK